MRNFILTNEAPRAKARGFLNEIPERPTPIRTINGAVFGRESINSLELAEDFKKGGLINGKI